MADTGDKLIELAYWGEEVYHGLDPETGQAVSAEPGERVAVRPAKAQQLLEDFPHSWAPLGVRPPSKPAGEESLPVSTENLLAKTRAQLEAQAEDLGIAAPAELPNKQAIAEAIVAALAA